MEKRDLALTATLLAASAAMGMGYYLTHLAPAVRAEVAVDGKTVETLDLSKDQEITIRGAQGGTNFLVIQDGTIRCSQASCPDKVCVRQGRQSRDGDMIVCLPNRVTVRVSGE